MGLHHAEKMPAREQDGEGSKLPGADATSDLVETMGIEPTTPCLQTRTSRAWRCVAVHEHAGDRGSNVRACA